jgi:hypothetical protein
MVCIPAHCKSRHLNRHSVSQFSRDILVTRKAKQNHIFAHRLIAGAAVSSLYNVVPSSKHFSVQQRQNALDKFLSQQESMAKTLHLRPSDLESKVGQMVTQKISERSRIALSQCQLHS